MVRVSGRDFPPYMISAVWYLAIYEILKVFFFIAELPRCAYIDLILHIIFIR